ncbi:MAG: YceI family protein [Polaromonas sp.]|uniref:YceI family protein n=1 Tax=Polaromonas sp. TaxID=1869339 RepID=UPI00272F6F21|nr:YceI family protein [Polaromonas sp.]MDP1739730.1 YceI family protein [Polaromonas sp.]MDP1953590.1 YceI family protein [Polaromonas sp.]MDP3357675.1 YceI family protein [Polaromonas sp.]MDP3750484.1 YceI family protein [Polaromonas sp.]
MSRLSIVLLSCLLPLSAMAAPVTYVIDPLHSYPTFTVNHLGMSTTYGRFDKMAGTITLDQAAKTGSLEAKIATASISTGDAKRADGTRSRDEHLRSPDFFNSAEFPEIVFKSTKFNFKGDDVESVDGTLTMLGVTKPVKLNVTSFKCGPHPFSKKPMCGADAQTSFKRTDWGMKFGVPAIGDEIKLIIGIEAYPQ